ncbi:cotranscriptional regulator FAM172A homolog isoform X1, partial [Tachysurus ichikawai]
HWHKALWSKLLWRLLPPSLSPSLPPLSCGAVRDLAVDSTCQGLMLTPCSQTLCLRAGLLQIPLLRLPSSLISRARPHGSSLFPKIQCASLSLVRSLICAFLMQDLSSGYAQIITQYVYELLEKDCKLRKEMLPVDATESEPKSFIYMSEDALTNQDKLLVLIQGSGVVRAGQWARRLIVNQDLDSGTQIPFINKAMQQELSKQPEKWGESEQRLIISTGESKKTPGKSVSENLQRTREAFYLSPISGGLSSTNLKIK